MEDEPPDDQRIRERDYHLHLAFDRYVDDVAVVVGRLSNAVDLNQLRAKLAFLRSSPR